MVYQPGLVVHVGRNNGAGLTGPLVPRNGIFGVEKSLKSELQIPTSKEL
jgi:hypothetical protein